MIDSGAAGPFSDSPSAEESRPAFWAGLTLAYAALTLVYTWPLARALDTTLASDLGDPALLTWVLQWNARAVPLTAEWWNAPMFYPLEGAFALSDTLLALTPLTTPLIWMGVGPMATYNLALLVSYPTAALAAHALAYRLTGRHDAALITGLSFGFGPYRVAQLSHLQMLFSCWLPLGLLALHRYVDAGRTRYLALAAAAWLMGGLTTGYFLVYFAVLIGLWMAWFLRGWRAWMRALAAFAAAALLLLPVLLTYANRQSSLGLSRGIDEIQMFSADLSGVWAALGRGGMLASRWTLEPGPEGALYPGLVILALGLTGAAVAWRRAPRLPRVPARRVLAALGALASAVALLSWWLGGLELSLAGQSLSVHRLHRPVTVALWLFGAALLCDRRVARGWRERSPVLFYGLATLAMLLLALGPVPRVFGERFMYKAPYAWLMELPGGDALRVPARFGLLFVLCLSVVAALAVARLRPGRFRTPLVGAMAVIIVAEAWMPVMPMPRVPPMLHAADVDPRAIVIELPLDHHFADMRALLRSIDHRRPLINGFSGYHPPHYFVMAEGIKAYRDASVLSIFQRFGPLIVSVSHDEGEAVHEQYRAFAETVPGIRLLRDTAAGTLYTLPAVAAAADVPLQPMPIASIRVTGDAPVGAPMTDGDVTTRWKTPRHQAVGDQVTVTLEQPADLVRIELEVGRWFHDFPRRLRIGVAAAAGEPAVTVWEGGGAGPTVLGALEDPARVPIRFNLPAGTRGQQIVLTLIDEHLALPWSVAELRVLGRQ